MKREASIINPTQTLQFDVEWKSNIIVFMIIVIAINRYFWLTMNPLWITQLVVLQYIKWKHFYNNIHVRIPVILHASSAYMCNRDPNLRQQNWWYPYLGIQGIYVSFCCQEFYLIYSMLYFVKLFLGNIRYRGCTWFNLKIVVTFLPKSCIKNIK